MLNELIILGQGPTHVDCDYHCETWGVNGGYSFAKRLDKLFMTDSLQGEVLHEEYGLSALLKFRGTIVLAKHFPVFDGLNIPIEIYPINDIQSEFHNTVFFSNSICYMLAYALYNKYSKIWIYGVDFPPGIEKKQEEAGITFWMGVALGKEVEITVPKNSTIGKTWNNKMYGGFR